MKTLSVVTPSKNYPIYIGKGILDQGVFSKIFVLPAKLVIVSNDVVAPIYLQQITKTLIAAGHEVTSVVLPDGEDKKNWHTLNLIFDALLENAAERSTTLVALGGGVIGDMTGFAAAVYQRGVPFIQIPTTVLAQVDSSVGGKTAINHPLGKNMIGAFYQPNAVVIDLAVLDTLPVREVSAGLAEVIKYGLICDRSFFEWLEQNVEGLLTKDMELLAYAVGRSCENKANVVGIDEEERGLRAILNLGHTFGHAIETALGYGVWLHGEAVAVGMLIAAKVSRDIGKLADEDVLRLENILLRAGLPVEPPMLGFEKWLDYMSHDKKVDAGKIRFVLLEKIGEAFMTSDVPADVLKRYLK